MFDLGAHAGLDHIQLLLQAPDRCRLVQNLALARLHGHVPDHRLGRVGPLVGALIVGVGEDFSLLPVQQAVALDNVVNVGCRTTHGMNETE